MTNKLSFTHICLFIGGAAATIVLSLLLSNSNAKKETITWDCLVDHFPDSLNMCVQVTGTNGQFATKSDCEAYPCTEKTLFKCVAGVCKPDPDGQYSQHECQTLCNDTVHWDCDVDTLQCTECPFESCDYKGLESCLKDCVEGPRQWQCVTQIFSGYKLCEQLPDCSGRCYRTEEMCENNCGDISWKCINDGTSMGCDIQSGGCDPGDQNCYTSKETCENVCGNFKCIQDNCVSSPCDLSNPSCYASDYECGIHCHLPDPVVWVPSWTYGANDDDVTVQSCNEACNSAVIYGGATCSRNTMNMATQEQVGAVVDAFNTNCENGVGDNKYCIPLISLRENGCTRWSGSNFTGPGTSLMYDSVNGKYNCMSCQNEFCTSPDRINPCEFKNNDPDRYYYPLCPCKLTTTPVKSL